MFSGLIGNRSITAFLPRMGRKQHIPGARRHIAQKSQPKQAIPDGLLHDTCAAFFCFEQHTDRQTLAREHTRQARLEVPVRSFVQSPALFPTNYVKKKLFRLSGRYLHEPAAFAQCSNRSTPSHRSLHDMYICMYVRLRFSHAEAQERTLQSALT